MTLFLSALILLSQVTSVQKWQSPETRNIPTNLSIENQTEKRREAPIFKDQCSTDEGEKKSYSLIYTLKLSSSYQILERILEFYIKIF